MSIKKILNVLFILFFLLSMIIYFIPLSNSQTTLKIMFLVIVTFIGLSINNSNKKDAKISSVLLFILQFFLIVNNFFIFHTVVSGKSMEPTISENSIIFAEGFNLKIEKNDVVVYKNGKKNILKRVAALSGDEISLEKIDSKFYLKVNKTLYKNKKNEIYEITMSDLLYNLISSASYVLKENEIVLLGDNERVSVDSRKEGIYHLDFVVGKVLGY